MCGRLSAAHGFGRCDACLGWHRPGRASSGRLGRTRPMKVTHSLVQVMLALFESPHERHWGYELSKRAGVRSGVLYPILKRLLEKGWLSDGWEDPSETARSRPPRRYYVLTDEGRSQVGLLLGRARSDARFSALMETYA